MIKLKIFFVVALLSLIFVLGTFAPIKKIDRFVLPDGCCNYCANPSKSDCLRGKDKTVFLNTKCRGQLISAVLPDRKR